jgi:nicotinamidase/pyrazinamidase
MKVLLIIDMQNDFCPGGALGVQEADNIIPIINKLMVEGGYNHILASKDWHTQDHCSFNHWPIHCVQNTYGAEFVPGLQTDLIEKVFYKGTNINVDSYSAVIDNEKVQSTGLIEYLTELSLKNTETLQDCEIHVVGLALDYCVKFSAIDIAESGIDVSVVYDATKPVNLDQGDIDTFRLSDEQKALQDLKTSGVRILTTKDILRTNIEHPIESRPLDRKIQLSC